MQIILEVPDRLPEALDRALQELSPTEIIPYQDDHQIVELLASQPSPETILAIRPTPSMQARISDLLATKLAHFPDQRKSN